MNKFEKFVKDLTDKTLIGDIHWQAADTAVEVEVPNAKNVHDKYFCRDFKDGFRVIFYTIKMPSYSEMFNVDYESLEPGVIVQKSVGLGFTKVSEVNTIQVDKSDFWQLHRVINEMNLEAKEIFDAYETEEEDDPS